MVVNQILRLLVLVICPQAVSSLLLPMVLLSEFTALKEIRKAAIEQYGCLIPDGNVNVSLELPWTREPFLGSLRRQGMIQQWKQTDKEIAQTNLRHYEVVIDSKYLR